MLKKLIFVTMTLAAAQSVAFANGETSADRRGIFGVKEPEKHLLILGSGMFTEAYQPIYAYDLYFRCLAPYLEGYWKEFTWLLPSDALAIVPRIQSEIKSSAQKIFALQLKLRPELCSEDYPEIAGDPETLRTLNHMAGPVYERMAHLTGGADSLEKVFKLLEKEHPVLTCLSDLTLLEYLNEIQAQCSAKN